MRVNGLGETTEDKEVAVEVMVRASIRRQLPIMNAERGESIPTVVLRALGEIGIKVPKSQLLDRRGKQRQARGKSNGPI
jgi:hypothetical protein